MDCLLRLGLRRSLGLRLLLSLRVGLRLGFLLCNLVLARCAERVLGAVLARHGHAVVAACRRNGEIDIAVLKVHGHVTAVAVTVLVGTGGLRVVIVQRQRQLINGGDVLTVVPRCIRGHAKGGFVAHQLKADESFRFAVVPVYHPVAGVVGHIDRFGSLFRQFFLCVHVVFRKGICPRTFISEQLRQTDQEPACPRGTHSSAENRRSNNICQHGQCHTAARAIRLEIVLLDFLLHMIKVYTVKAHRKQNAAYQSPDARTERDRQQHRRHKQLTAPNESGYEHTDHKQDNRPGHRLEPVHPHTAVRRMV